MENTVTTKKRVSKKSPVEKEVIETGPFAAVAEEDSAKNRGVKRTVKTASVESPAIVTETKPVKRKPKTIVIDPFADIAGAAETTSPVKKRAADMVKSEKPAKAVKATAKTARKTSRKAAGAPTLDATPEIAAAKPAVELSPVFKALAEVALPELKKENRARLQMQTPTRAYFYWSLRENPWAMLRDVFGETQGSYTLVVKLIDKKHGREEIRQCEAEGNYWFDVAPEGEYQAEIGFYAPNRPYFRVLYSNTITTPRRSPSTRAATESDWTVSAAKFAEVLDVAGFKRDAFDVAVAGDDHAIAEDSTHIAFAQFMGRSDYDLNGITAADIRFAMMALASGLTIEELRWKVSPELFAILQSNAASIEPGKAMNALIQYFDIDEAEFTEEHAGSAVFGASLVHFPKTLKTRTITPKYAPRYNPVSSHSFRQ